MLPTEQELDRFFSRVPPLDAKFPVWNLTGRLGRCTQRFYDTTPISPSGRFVAVTQLASDGHKPRPGDTANIVLLDLLTGKLEIVAQSHCWDAQLGAQVQWGNSDAELYFNDLVPGIWKPFGIRMNPLTGETFPLDGTVYMISPTGTKAASPCLIRTARTQPGYGAVVPDEFVPRNIGAPTNDGVYITDTHTGKSRCLVSLSEIVDRTNLAKHSPTSELYGFHVKWSPSGSRLMFVVRNLADNGKVQSNIVTFASDGSDINLALGWSRWSSGGHHPNWIDDETILMNLRDSSGKMRFFTFRFDGSCLKKIHNNIVGSGHPTISPDGQAILTDDKEKHDEYKKMPLRYINKNNGKEEVLFRIGTTNTVKDENVMRVDMHPAWSPDGNAITFNGNEHGTRNVYLCLPNIHKLKETTDQRWPMLRNIWSRVLLGS